ncbi:serine/threonine-protein kinase ATG1a isoform X1 [Actinidia eriantha]|uniref:serine/threonine-protein kinase ATG1a isoform X1 n=1 Tax=Actinidia eriantha TaxID=165200 RepID=UPI00258366FB|nr:serine/threonine-protein kinase ATG1a isoform X1 [Actinidia eriantha]
MDLGECRRVIGNYILGPRIGKGSFAVVWRSTHRHSGAEVAVKEIDKKHLTHTKVGENLLKEISILTNIRHPNIIRLFEAIETEDRIYLVLEYCDGGDLAAYIHRLGKVSQSLASHFIRQLAAGLQVLHVNRLIHRDLKPQNLLLSTNGEIPLLKIGDFGFARYLAPQGLADTLCGSPLYMAPEIIQNKKYDGKADLWSVGAILFQLVTGKPPFNGDSQLQLFQNILSSSELCFPEGSLKNLNPDCVALCRGLLRHNPVERLTFEEFFNHKFLAEPRMKMDVEKLEQFEGSSDKILTLASDKMPQLQSPFSLNSFKRSSEVAYSSFHDNDDKLLYAEDHGSTLSTQGVQVFTENVACDRLETSLGGKLKSSVQLRAIDLMESFEKDFVLVNAHFASTETSSCSSGICLLNNSTSGIFSHPSEKNDQDVAAEMPVKECTTHSLSGPKSQGSYVSASSVSTVLREVQGLSILHPSTRLQLLHQYICVLSELARGKFNAGLVLESFSVELVVLAIWKEAFQVCNYWLDSNMEDDLPGKCSAKESRPIQEAASLFLNSEENVDFNIPRAVSIWAEQGFLVTFDRAENLSIRIQDMDGNAQMPDAMEIVFQAALEVARTGGVDEFMGNNDSAAVSYSKAMLLLLFLLGEAMSLPLNPTFSLTPADRKRIEGYLVNFESRHSHFKMSQASPKQSLDCFTN